MQITRSFTTHSSPLLNKAAVTITIGLLLTWSPLLGGLVVSLALLVHLARTSGSSVAQGHGAVHAPAVSAWDDDLFTEPSLSCSSIEVVDVLVLRPNDLHVYGDGLLSGGCWDDDFSNCGAGSNYPSFD